MRSQAGIRVIRNDNRDDGNLRQLVHALFDDQYEIFQINEESRVNDEIITEQFQISLRTI